MSSSPSDHKAVTRHEFTRQSAAYAANPLVADRSQLTHLVQAARPRPQDRILDVATGPGFVALAFAEQTRRSRGLTNVRFQLGMLNNFPLEK
jgi:ubiquinone/menaquinone biosynthesis C-methylase UbiE